MKKTLKRCLQFCLRSDVLWFAVKGLPVKGLRTARKKVIAQRWALRLRDHPVVRSGPFAGLVYPVLDSAGSVLVAKLLGTYESELHPAIAALRRLEFATIVDVGCAEGYYAVGLGRMFPSARVLAYDTSERARRLCGLMADANDTANVEVRGHCGREALAGLSADDRNLVVSDCEGYERELFTEDAARRLVRSHFVIELHDPVEGADPRPLVAWFSRTHDTQLIRSIDDAEKARRYRSLFVTSTDELEREAAFAENRGRPMEWLVAAPRTTAAP